MANPGQQPLTVEQRLTQNGENFQEHQTVEEVLSNSQKDLDLLTVEQRMRSESEALESSIINGSESLSEQDSLGRKVASLLNEYKALRDGISSREGSRRTRNQLRHRLKQNIRNLEAIQEDLGKYKYHNLTTYKSRVLELDYYFEHYEQVRQLIVLGGRTGDIHAIIDSKQDARRARKQEKQNARYQSSMNDILHEAALTSLWDRDMERYEEYLEAVLNGQVEPSTHPFYTAHRQSFALIQQTSPELYGTLVPRGGGRIAYNTYCQREPQLYQQCCRRYNEGFNTKFGKGMTDILAKVFPGIDSDPRKRQAREKAGSVIALGGAVVMGFQFFKNLFSKKADNPNKWGKAAGWGAGLLALFYGDRVIDWAKDAFGIHPAEKSRMLMEISSTYGFSDTEAMEIADRYISAPIATMSALHFIPIYDLVEQHIIENKNGEFSFNNKNFKKFANQYSREKDQKEQVLKAGDKLDKDKSIGAGLKAFGITTRNKLTSLFKGDKNKTLADTDEAKTGWTKMVERVESGVNKHLFEHGLRAKDTDAMDKIMSEFGDDSQKSQKEINRLMLDRMRRGLLELASDDKKYTINDMLSDIEFSSQMDLENMTMKGFTNSGGTEITFDSYRDLFDTVRLTKWIKENFKRPAVSDHPFHIDTGKGRIEFDDTKRYEIWKNETDVVKNRTLRETSSLLSKNKQNYVDYLNRRRRNAQKIEIDEIEYPMASKLGIEFYNGEEEVKNIDIRLKKIKMDSIKNVRVPNAGENKPFKIKGKELKFTRISGKITVEDNLSRFPTIRKSEENKQKLLDFLNDKSNKMCNR